MEIFYFSIREKREMDFVEYSIDGKSENILFFFVIFIYVLVEKLFISKKASQESSFKYCQNEKKISTSVFYPKVTHFLLYF
jgi:hypothetical protein